MAEFAPGIPVGRETLPLSTVKKPSIWRFVVQQHPAERAGDHFDLRLVDEAGHAHSWATRKDWFLHGYAPWEHGDPREKKAYAEGPESQFTHAGNRYAVDGAIAAAAHSPVEHIPVTQLAWVLEHAQADPARVEAADLKAPILVAPWREGLVVVDGLHRLQKAVQEGHETILAKRLDPQHLRKALLEKRASIPGLSKEKRRALNRAESFFSEDDKHKKWDRFADDVRRKSFTKAVQDDPRADDKLRLHAENLSRLKTGKTVGKVNEYRIVELRGGGLGCTCGDWRYVRSVASPGSRDCKHIREFRAKKKG